MNSATHLIETIEKTTRPKDVAARVRRWSPDERNAVWNTMTSSMKWLTFDATTNLHRVLAFWVLYDHAPRPEPELLHAQTLKAFVSTMVSPRSILAALPYTSAACRSIVMPLIPKAAWMECSVSAMTPLLPPDEWERIACLRLDTAWQHGPYDALFLYDDNRELIRRYAPTVHDYLSMVLNEDDWSGTTIRSLASPPPIQHPAPTLPSLDLQP